MSEERLAKEQLAEELHTVRSRALQEEAARGSRSAQEVRDHTKLAYYFNFW